MNLQSAQVYMLDILLETVLNIFVYISDDTLLLIKPDFNLQPTAFVKRYYHVTWCVIFRCKSTQYNCVVQQYTKHV